MLSMVRPEKIENKKKTGPLTTFYIRIAPPF
jgi:hypothetical protein